MNNIVLFGLLFTIMIIIDIIFNYSLILYGPKILSFPNLIYNIQKSKLEINYIGAFLSYIFLTFGLYYFIIKDKNSSFRKKLFNSFILGLTLYGVFEATNLALFKQWSPYIFISDTLWGATLMFLTTYTFNVLLKFLGQH
jgi:uncharacterized membrane protein